MPTAFEKMIANKGQRIQINGIWVRTDLNATIWVLDKNDITPQQLLSQSPCQFCDLNIPHSELLHVETILDAQEAVEALHASQAAHNYGDF